MTVRTAKRRTPPPIIFFILGIILFVSVPRILPFVQSKMPASVSMPVPTRSIADRMSLGDRLLFPTPTPDQQKGADAFARGDYRAAIDHFQASLHQRRNDPETRIYLNNAVTGDQPSLRIAVSVPIGSNPNVAQEILRGVAQAQQEINQAGGIRGTKLQVQIANDDNKEDLAKQIAETLVNDSKILAVVGHNASNASLAAAPIYQQGDLVMVTPTSFANALSGFGDSIFRTVPTIQSMATPLAEYVVQQVGVKTIALCYDSQAPDNLSFKAEFSTAFSRLGGQVASVECDFAAPNFSPQTAINTVLNSPAQGLLLAPHIDRINRAIALAQVNQNQLPLFASPTLYTMQTLQEGGSSVRGMTLSVPWFPAEPFTSSARKLWGGTVNWRTANGYDATQAIITALQQDPTRIGIRNTLRSASFSASGATAEVQFLPTGDRVGQGVLVQVAKEGGSDRFVRVKEY